MSNIIKQLPNNTLPIKGAIDTWVDTNGNIYKIDKRLGKDHLIKMVLNNIKGYLYCTITYKNNFKKSKKVDKLVAETFIPNPNKLPIVEHKNNIKTDNRIENLYWTIIKENIKKNISNESKPVKMFETKTNKYIRTFNSISEAANVLEINESTIARQAKYHRPIRKKYYFRFIDDESAKDQKIIAQYDYYTNKLTNVFYSISDAELHTNIDQKIILAQCIKNKKPRYSKLKYYFQYL